MSVLLLILSMAFGYFVVGELILGHFMGRLYLPDNIWAAFQSGISRVLSKES